MAINKGDRVAHLHGMLGTALTAETGGSVQVMHDSGAVSTWAAGDTAVISRSVPGPAAEPSRPQGSQRRVSKKRTPRKRKPAKTTANKRTAKVKKRASTVRSIKPAVKKRTRKPG